MAKSKRMRATSGNLQTQKSFAQALDAHRQKLGWTQTELGKRAQFSAGQISGWLDVEAGKPAGRNHINRLAWALASGYEDKHPRSAEVDSLESLLSELLRAAGYSDGLRARKSRISRLIEDKKPLRIGVVNYPPFADSQQQGLAIEIAQRVLDLMGVERNWVTLSWADLIPQLTAEQIDLVAPVFLKLPMRSFKVLFSMSIEGLLVGANGIIHKDYVDDVRSGDELKEVKAERLIVSFAEGEVGETMSRMIARTTPQVGRLFSTVEESCQHVLEEPKSMGKYRCFVADHVTCFNLLSQHPEARLLFESKRDVERRVRLPLAFAAHPAESELILVVNECLEIMKESGDLLQLIERYETQLRTLSVLTPDIKNKRKEQELHKPPSGLS
jgi:transcriptional regulator with XRE-family HTH domain